MAPLAHKRLGTHDAGARKDPHGQGGLEGDAGPDQEGKDKRRHVCRGQQGLCLDGLAERVQGRHRDRNERNVGEGRAEEEQEDHWGNRGPRHAAFTFVEPGGEESVHLVEEKREAPGDGDGQRDRELSGEGVKRSQGDEIHPFRNDIVRKAADQGGGQRVVQGGHGDKKSIPGGEAQRQRSGQQDQEHGGRGQKPASQFLDVGKQVCPAVSGSAAQDKSDGQGEAQKDRQGRHRHRARVGHNTSTGRGAFTLWSRSPFGKTFKDPAVAGVLEETSALRATCSAPGKVILFGEHAVVYGHPAVAAATDQRTLVEVDCCGDRFTVNGYRLQERYHAYLRTAVERCWPRKDAVRIQTEGGVPSASGTGSSAALTVATVAALRRLQGMEDLPGLAQAAFETERATQGGGSPTDTTTSVAGGGIAIAGSSDPARVGEKLWDVQWPLAGEERSWTVERVEFPVMHAVIGNSGVKGRTDEQVAKVAMAAKKNAIVRDALSDIGAITRDAVPALKRKDWSAVGAFMNRAHSALHTLGVNHPAVERLVLAARAVPGTWGAKLTGAGGGGSMVALTDRPQDVARALEDAGGTAFVVQLGSPGVQVHDVVAV